MSDAHPQQRIKIGEEKARGAQRVGLVWMLVASLVVVVILMAIVLAYFSGELSEANRRGGPASVPKADAAQFHTPG
jgi:hypothetical protein